MQTAHLRGVVPNDDAKKRAEWGGNPGGPVTAVGTKCARFASLRLKYRSNVMEGWTLFDGSVAE